MTIVSSTQAKARFSELVERSAQGDEIIVQRRGKPVAVILSYETYQDLQALQERARRQEALARLRALAREVQRQNQFLTEEEREGVAEATTRAAVESLITRGAVRFEGP